MCAIVTVALAGNGPSGICLSYMLAGNWPYITTSAHPDELLMARLQDVDLTKSLLMQVIALLSTHPVHDVRATWRSLSVSMSATCTSADCCTFPKCGTGCPKRKEASNLFISSHC